ncbi:MAG: leucine-rich repeat domain-containing protein [Acinetobacter sp.]|nr:leucine-rich repeat domain-containing protein [Acinetobacter sp.]
MAIKSVAVYQNDLVIRDEQDTIHVVKVTDKESIERYEVSSAALNDIAQQVKLKREETWNVRTFGRKLIEFLNENSAEKNLTVAIYGNELIVQEVQDSKRETVHVLHLNGKDVERYTTSLPQLERIAQDLKVEYERAKTNTRSLGAKLIAHLNATPAEKATAKATVKVSKASTAAAVPAIDFAWWKGLSYEWHKEFAANLDINTYSVDRFLDETFMQEYLERLKNLKELIIYEHCITVSDITPLAGLINLKKLVLRGQKLLTDISPLAHLTKLQELDLQECEQITDISPLANLTKLKDLYLGGCKQITDISPLAHLTKLQELE